MSPLSLGQLQAPATSIQPYQKNVNQLLTPKENGYRKQRRVFAVSLANLKKGPAKRGYRFAASYEERCKFSFPVYLLPDDGTPLANHWILSTHGVDSLTCATHTHIIQELILHYYQTTLETCSHMKRNWPDSASSFDSLQLLRLHFLQCVTRWV
jgi:hypothetical protein